MVYIIDEIKCDVTTDTKLLPFLARFPRKGKATPVREFEHRRTVSKPGKTKQNCRQRVVIEIYYIFQVSGK
jgi:hypothetical protein